MRSEVTVTVRSNAAAPYGPPAGILAMIDGFRNRGLTTPFGADVYARAGISESLIPRVKNSMEGLDLVDGEGNPTPQLIALRQAKTDEYKATLADVIKAAYAEVFQFVDPLTDDLTRVTDAFRTYEPHGQRGRMVTLFMGLCEAAGLAPSTTGKSTPSSVRPSASTKKRLEAPRRMPPASTSDMAPSVRVSGGVTGIPPALLGVLGGLPCAGKGWTQKQRNHFYTAFGALLDFSIPIIEHGAEPDDTSGDDGS